MWPVLQTENVFLFLSNPDTSSKQLYYTISHVIYSWQDVVNLKTMYIRTTLKYFPNFKIILP